MTFNRSALRLAVTLFIAIAAIVQPCNADGNPVDAVLAATHQQAAVDATEICDDASFLRRISLDLLGRVPTTDELKAFHATADRTGAVDRLLESPEHVRFWSQLWSVMLVGRGEQRYVEREVLRSWVEQQLADQRSLQQMAFELITAEGVSALEGPVNFIVASREDPVMRLSRTFLGVQLDCAQCHDHPHDRWTNIDYLAMKRFFQPTQYREVSGGIAVSDSTPGDRQDLPIFLTGRVPHTSAWRRELGLMVVQSKPFSRAMVNRAWSWLMGRGIVNPVDGLSRDNPPIVPDLLESLATRFREGGYQLRPLIKEICTSQAYQRSPTNRPDAEGEQQRAMFAARTVRPQLPEQWLASLSVVLGRPVPLPADLAKRSSQLLGVTQRNEVVDPFQWEATSQVLIRQLSEEVPPPLRDLDSIFLSTLARPPAERERNLAASHSAQEMLFALVHSSEFLMND